MESANRDEARKCLLRAKSAFNKGAYGEADRLARKSIRLCPSREAEDFLMDISEKMEDSHQDKEGVHTSGQSYESAPSNESPGVRHRQPSSPRQQPREKSPQREYTVEQQEAVQRVLCCSNYYDILEVGRDASETDLKKQYKRLALSLHPDKNAAPKSDEAFKAVGNAYSVLSDPTRRNQYDRFGEDGLRTQGVATDPDFSPDDLFRMFFGDDFMFGGNQRFMYTGDGVYTMFGDRHPRRRRFHQHHHNRQQTPASNWMHFCQLLPLVFILVISLSSSLLQSYFAEPPPFSLYRTSEYSVKRIVDKYKIQYYVKTDFMSQYRNKLAVVERDVVSERLFQLQQQCMQERLRSKSDTCKKFKDLQQKIRRHDKVIYH